MWTYIIPSLCLVVSLLTVPWLTKCYAERQLKLSLKQTLQQFQNIANAYTENGTPAELAQMIEDLEEVMEELKFLDKNE